MKFPIMDKPMLIMVMGLPGSGKTFFARALAKKIGGIHFNSDIIRKQQQQHTTYTAKNKFQVYQTMLENVCRALDQQKKVIVDATFSLQRYREPYINFVREQQIPFKAIMITANEGTIFSRLQHPRPDSDADFGIYQKIKSEFEPLNLPYLQLNSDQYSLEELVKMGLAYINKVIP